MKSQQGLLGLVFQARKVLFSGNAGCANQVFDYENRNGFVFGYDQGSFDARSCVNQMVAGGAIAHKTLFLKDLYQNLIRNWF
jgi:hypothetical protein